MLFRFETENGNSYRDFVARFERAPLHWNSVNESAGVAIEITQNQLTILRSNAAVLWGHRGVVEANGAFQIPSYNQVCADWELGFS
jgi:hypothetical protein